MDTDARERLIKLEATFKERWDNHDKRSDDNWETMQAQVRAILVKLDNLPCKTHIEKFKGQARQVAWIWGLLIIIVGGVLWKMR